MPTDGWGFDWVGDPDLGNDWRQPGGWLYNVLPFIEQQPLHDLGVGLGNPGGTTPPAKNLANLERVSTVVSIFYCPTRRRATLCPLVPSTTDWPADLMNCTIAASTVFVRNDYAVNGGDRWTFSGYGQDYSSPGWQDACPWWGGGPANLSQAMTSAGQMTSGAKTTFTNVAGQATGVSYCGSLIRLSDITDGASNTFLAGEKYINADFYTTGQDGSDNECAFIGDDDDIIRFGGDGNPATSSYTPYPPMADTPGVGYDGFGSAHLAGVQMAFCDGSVHVLNFSIDFETYRRLCNRKDGLMVDGKKY